MSERDAAVAALAKLCERFFRDQDYTGFRNWPVLATAILDALSPDDARAIARALPGTLDYESDMHPERRLVWISYDLLAQFGSRTERGELITSEWGQREADGTFTPTFTVHSDDRIGELDAAWAEVEAALPEGWHVFEVVKQSDASWLAVAGRRDYLWNGPNSEAGSGPTPAAALLNLAEKLRERGA